MRLWLIKYSDYKLAIWTTNKVVPRRPIKSIVRHVSHALEVTSPTSLYTCLLGAPFSCYGESIFAEVVSVPTNAQRSARIIYENNY